MSDVSASTITSPSAWATARGRVARLQSLLERDGLLVVAVAAFAAVLITHLRTALETDGWMALLSGRIVAAHGLPSHDTLTIWAHGRPWTDQQWLAQLVLYELDRLGGLTLVLLVHAALVVAAVAGAATLARRLGGSARSATWISLPMWPAPWPEASVMRPRRSRTPSSWPSSGSCSRTAGAGRGASTSCCRCSSSGPTCTARFSSAPRSPRPTAGSRRSARCDTRLGAWTGARSSCSARPGSASSPRRTRPRSPTTTA